MTLGHNTITSYPDFTQSLIERFDRKDPKVHFRELAQLKQTGSADAFISEFQRIRVHDKDVHEEIALEPSCESSDTSTSDSQIVDKSCDELELVHSSSPTAGVQTVMTGEIHEVQGNELNSRDSEQSHMEVTESLYMHEIEVPDDSHRKKIERVKEIILEMKERTMILWKTILQ